MHADYTQTIMPPSGIFSLLPSPELIMQGILTAPKTVKSTDIGSSISLPYKNIGKKKTIKKGSRIFKGLLHYMLWDTLDVLPFVAGKLTGQKRRNIINDSL